MDKAESKGVYQQVVLKLECVSGSPEGLMRRQITGLVPEIDSLYVWSEPKNLYF